MSNAEPHPFTAAAALARQAIEQHVFPACAWGILWPREDGRLEQFTAAAGRFTDEPDSPPVNPETIFDLASLTKVLATTAAAMLLFERGALHLEEPLATRLPMFVGSDPRRGRITLRMLLDHSSGLPGYVRLFERAKNREALLDACLQEPLTADPGARAEYSDIGFILLGYWIEMATDEALDQFCAREIFAPLGMKSTCFRPAAGIRSLIPPTEDDATLRHRVIQGEVNDENAYVMGGVAGHAGLFANVRDVLRLASSLLMQGRTDQGRQLFAAKTIELFAQRSREPADTSRALGWDTPSVPSSSGTLFSTQSIGHLGFTGTSLWIDRAARVAVVLLTNRTWPDRSNQAIRAFRPQFHDALRHAILRKRNASQHSE